MTDARTPSLSVVPGIADPPPAPLPPTGKELAIEDLKSRIRGEADSRFKASHAKEEIVRIGRTYGLTRVERKGLYKLVDENMVDRSHYTPAAIRARIAQEKGGITRMGGVHSAVGKMLRLGLGDEKDAEYLRDFARSQFDKYGEGPSRAEKKEAREKGKQEVPIKASDNVPSTELIYCLVSTNSPRSIPYLENYRGVRLLISSEADERIDPHPDCLSARDRLSRCEELNTLLDVLLSGESYFAVEYVALLGDYAVVTFKGHQTTPVNPQVYKLEEVQVVEPCDGGVE